jgi:hypothetical protein
MCPSATINDRHHPLIPHSFSVPEGAYDDILRRVMGLPRPPASRAELLWQGFGKTVRVIWLLIVLWFVLYLLIQIPENYRRVHPGQKAFVRTSFAIASIDLPSRGKYLAATRLGDTFEVLQLSDSGKVATLTLGTELLVLDSEIHLIDNQGSVLWRVVRVTSGEHVGKKVVVQDRDVGLSPGE